MVICTLYVFLSVVKHFEFQKAVCWVVQWSWFARVNALRNISCKKSREVAASCLARFLSAGLLHIVYNNGSWTLNCEAVQMPPLLQLQKWLGKGDGGWGKKSLHQFLADRRSRVHGKNAFWGILQREQQVIACCHTFWLRASKNAFKSGSVKFANSPSPPSIVKKVRTGSKSSQGT